LSTCYTSFFFFRKIICVKTCWSTSTQRYHDLVFSWLFSLDFLSLVPVLIYFSNFFHIFLKFQGTALFLNWPLESKDVRTKK
jgi:hypothetical protein